MYDQLRRKALEDLLSYYGDNKTQLALAFGVSRNAISYWFTRGRIGRKSAERLDRMDTPFSKEKVRPDIKIWKHNV
jgi:transposase